MAFANMNPSGFNQTTPPTDSTTTSTATPAVTAITPNTIVTKKSVRRIHFPQFASLKSKVHLYKLVVSSVLGVMFFGVYYSYYTSRYSFTMTEYTSTNEYLPIDLIAIAKTRTLTDEEKTSIYTTYLQAPLEAHFTAVYNQITAGSGVNLTNHAEAISALPLAMEDQLTKSYSEIREKFKLSESHEAEILAYGITAEPPITLEISIKTEKIAFDAAYAYSNADDEALANASALFSIAGALGHERAAEASVILDALLNESQKDASAIAMNSALGTYELDASIFSEHAAADEPIIEEPIIEPTVEIASSISSTESSSSSKVITTVSPSSITPTQKEPLTPEVIEIMTESSSSSAPLEVATDESDSSAIQSTTSTESSSSEYFRVNKRSLRENFDWYQKRER